MNSELEACFDKWEASFDALCRYLLDTASGVTAAASANSGTIEFVLASAGLAEPPAPASAIVASPVVAPAIPIDASAMVPAICSTEGPSCDATELTHTLNPAATPTSPSATMNVTAPPLLPWSSFLTTAASSIRCHRLLLRPRPWPSFACDIGLFQFVQYLIHQLVGADFSSQEDSVITVRGNIYQEAAYVFSGWVDTCLITAGYKSNCLLHQAVVVSGLHPGCLDFNSKWHGKSKLALLVLVHWPLGVACNRNSETFSIKEGIKDTRKIMEHNLAQPSTTKGTMGSVLVFYYLAPSFCPVAVLGLQLAESGNSCVCLQELQLDRNGIEVATFNGVITNINPCQLKWFESILASPVDMSPYCTSFSIASEGTFCESKLEFYSLVSYRVVQNIPSFYGIKTGLYSFNVSSSRTMMQDNGVCKSNIDLDEGWFQQSWDTHYHELCEILERQKATESTSSPLLPTADTCSMGDCSSPATFAAYGVVSTELVANTDNDEHHTTLDDSSDNVIPFSVVPALSLTAGAHDDSMSVMLSTASTSDVGVLHAARYYIPWVSTRPWLELMPPYTPHLASLFLGALSGSRPEASIKIQSAVKTVQSCTGAEEVPAYVLSGKVPHKDKIQWPPWPPPWCIWNVCKLLSLFEGSQLDCNHRLFCSLEQEKQVADSAAGHVYQVLLQSDRAEICQLLTHPGEYLNLCLQLKPSWLSIPTKNDTEVDEGGVHPHVEEIKYVQLLLQRPYSELPIEVCLHELQFTRTGMEAGLHFLYESTSTSLLQATRIPHNNQKMELCRAARELLILQTQGHGWIYHGFVLLCYSQAILLSAQGADEDGIVTRKHHRVLVQHTKAPWDPGGSTWCRWFSPCDNQGPFQGGRRIPAFDQHKELRSPCDPAGAATGDQLNNCSRQWDPGGFSVASAWGQAESQGGRDVRTSTTDTHRWAGHLDRHMGLPTSRTCRLQIHKKMQRGRHPGGSETDMAAAPPLPPWL